MSASSFALGRWRGRMGKPLAVRLAPTICPDAYREGWDKGRAERKAERPRKA